MKRSATALILSATLVCGAAYAASSTSYSDMHRKSIDGHLDKQLQKQKVSPQLNSSFLDRAIKTRLIERYNDHASTSNGLRAKPSEIRSDFLTRAYKTRVVARNHDAPSSENRDLVTPSSMDNQEALASQTNKRQSPQSPMVNSWLPSLR